MDANDHVLWGKLSPFTSDNANTETGTVKWESSKTPIASGFKNAAFIESGKEVTLDFKAEDDGILYIKWANKPSSGTTCNGGGTIKLSKIVKQIVIDE